MCSMTHWGLRRRRSKEEMRACRAAMSHTGPGKPYSNSPEGSTGKGPPRVAGAEVERPCCWFGGVKICLDGIGIGAEVAFVETVVVVVDDIVWLAVSSLRSDCDLNEYIVAVMAAPAPALAAAIIAKVVLDIVLAGGSVGAALGIPSF